MRWYFAHKSQMVKGLYLIAPLVILARGEKMQRMDSEEANPGAF